MIITRDNELIISALQKGKIIAYPTESVYGVGCDPANERAVRALLELKQRPLSKGLILIASSWEQVQPWTLPLSPKILQKIMEYPSPCTWVFPASADAPAWITGDFTSIAIRLTQHPIAKNLCELFGAPLVSTSANISGAFPAKTIKEVQDEFPIGVELIVEGVLGGLEKPTPIRDVLTNKLFRD
jgi:L-threonylcarbamoyladenylate synthase